MYATFDDTYSTKSNFRYVRRCTAYSRSSISGSTAKHEIFQDGGLWIFLLKPNGLMSDWTDDWHPIMRRE